MKICWLVLVGKHTVLAGSARDQMQSGLETILSSLEVATSDQCEDREDGSVGMSALLLAAFYLSCGCTELTKSCSLKAKNSLYPKKPMGKDILS